ncbi:MAG: DUF2189 domain-containing protein [Xanthomonadales bacterium]|nr:DUF2189 domain-containing protein [Xanthomonadales bacterium]NIX12120.1 DUF2189 domain-containing protein [Xanthomonadales bacterium]
MNQTTAAAPPGGAESEGHSDRKAELPFVAPHRELGTFDAFGWLALGWRDFRTAPRVSLVYGFGVFLVTVLIAWLAYQLGGYVLLLSALSGFVFIAPLLAFALYSVSRQICEGREPSLRRTFRAMRRPLGNAVVFALILLVVFMVWARAGMMVYVFFPVEGAWTLGDVATFLGVGSAVGCIFATFTFATVATSLPMLANREVDVVTAVVSSINVVLRNKPAMFVWAVTIVLLTLVGFLTAFLGLIVIIPWLAYATWHSYRAALDVSAWPILQEGHR